MVAVATGAVVVAGVRCLALIAFQNDALALNFSSQLVPCLSFHRLAPLTAVLATLAVAATTCAYATAIKWYLNIATCCLQ